MNPLPPPPYSEEEEEDKHAMPQLKEPCAHCGLFEATHYCVLDSYCKQCWAFGLHLSQLDMCSDCFVRKDSLLCTERASSMNKDVPCKAKAVFPLHKPRSCERHFREHVIVTRFASRICWSCSSLCSDKNTTPFKTKEGMLIWLCTKCDKVPDSVAAVADAFLVVAQYRETIAPGNYVRDAYWQLRGPVFYFTNAEAAEAKRKALASSLASMANGAIVSRARTYPMKHDNQVNIPLGFN